MYASVIVDITNKNVDKIFNYRVPEKFHNIICRGMRVKVPFGRGNSIRCGYVTDLTEQIYIDEDKVKDIAAISDNYPVLSETMLELAFWMKEKYYTTLAACIQCILPKIMKGKKDKFVSINYGLDNIDSIVNEIIKKGNLQSRVLAMLKKGSVSLAEIKLVLGISGSPVAALEKKKVVFYTEKESMQNVCDTKNFNYSKPLHLNEEQKKAFDLICDNMNCGGKTVLLHGVTGSGKTEVYLQVIDEVIKQGKQAIVLVPEISLTPQTVQRFIMRFGDKVTVTHSRLSDGERYDQWRKAMNGEISIMVGARSAVFTPFKNLGCIIIDEEHEHTYKSEISPKYSAKEVAVKLSDITGCLVLLGSATPAIDSYYKAKTGTYGLAVIKKRVNGNPPSIEIVDMRQELAMGNRSIFSERLKDAIKENLKNKKQTILFLNRRGHSTFVSCRSCGYVMKCDNCSVNYTYHYSIDRLMCHYCGVILENPKNCPQCGSEYIKYFGAGTQKIEEKVQDVFPEAKILRMDLDTTKKKNSHENILKEFGSGKADILIGTQMIAKGLDFPNVTLVGVVAADMSVNSGDFKCAESCFQLLTQVAGRAGRAESCGKVYIQTYQPDHYSILYAKNEDYEKFYDHEIKLRKQMNYPPFSHIFVVMFTGRDERKIIIRINELMTVMKKYNKKANGRPFDLLGPSQAIVSKINNMYRYKITIKGDTEERVKNFVLFCMDKLIKNADMDGINPSLTLDPEFMQ